MKIKGTKKLTEEQEQKKRRKLWSRKDRNKYKKHSEEEVNKRSEDRLLQLRFGDSLTSKICLNRKWSV